MEEEENQQRSAHQQYKALMMKLYKSEGWKRVKRCVGRPKETVFLLNLKNYPKGKKQQEKVSKIIIASTS